MPFLRRSVIAFAALAALAGPAAAADRVGAGDLVMGSPNAKVTVIEYASVTCPHCAQFHNEVFPAFKAKYVDTGQVRFIFREFPTGPVEVAMAGFMLARCSGRDRYFAVLDALFKAQDEMYATRSAQKFLGDAAKAGGLDEAATNACLQDQAALAAMTERAERAQDVDKVTGTPTFVIGETRLVGSQPLAALDRVIQPLLAR